MEYRHRPSGPSRGGITNEHSTSRSTISPVRGPATASVASSVNDPGNTDTARNTRRSSSPSSR
jgi:hypothetical protein